MAGLEFYKKWKNAPQTEALKICLLSSFDCFQGCPRPKIKTKIQKSFGIQPYYEMLPHAESLSLHLKTVLIRVTLKWFLGFSYVTAK